MQSRWILICLTAALVLGSSSANGREERSGRPNVIIILADDLGWADLGCYGSKYHKTPNWFRC